MDQVAARYLGPTYLPSLALSWTNGVGSATLSRNSLGVDVPALANYKTIFTNLFPPADKRQLAEMKARFALDKSVLDNALGSVKDLKRQVGRADQSMIEQYLDSIRDVEKRFTIKEGILSKGRPKFDESGVDLTAEGKNKMEDHIEIMMDMIVIAFQTDMTRVVTHVLGGEGGPNYEEYKTWALLHGKKPLGAHDSYHKVGPVIESRDTLLCEQLARLMKKLKDTQVSNGTLLDNTAILFGGAQVRSHSGDNFPTILAGGKALGFKHGQHLQYKKKTVPMSDLYLTILQQLGCPVKSFKESRGNISPLLA
ncbi:MAG: DUF1552 domain-containing protein [Planctomycetes bacterium]|nr:DUF1552 domain-containing protein [Planctomycetota bacterium]